MFIIEISSCGSSSICPLEGENVSPEILSDLKDCTSVGDCEESCEYILSKYSPEIRTVRQTGSEFENVLASAEEKERFCRKVYFESESEFADEDIANLYIVWEAAHSHCDELGSAE